MFEVYNKNALTQKQRFLWAIAGGVVSSVVIGYLYGLIQNALYEQFNFSMVFSIVYVGIGYAVGWVIQTVGRGVQVRFSVLGAICALLSFLIADLVFIYPYSFTSVNLLIRGIQGVLSLLIDPSMIIVTAFKAFGVYVAYVNSRFVR